MRGNCRGKMIRHGLRFDIKFSRLKPSRSVDNLGSGLRHSNSDESFPGRRARHGYGVALAGYVVRGKKAVPPTRKIMLVVPFGI